MSVWTGRLNNSVRNNGDARGLGVDIIDNKTDASRLLTRAIKHLVHLDTVCRCCSGFKHATDGWTKQSAIDL
jgi:hypothetical protein